MVGQNAVIVGVVLSLYGAYACTDSAKTGKLSGVSAAAQEGDGSSGGAAVHTPDGASDVPPPEGGGITGTGGRQGGPIQRDQLCVVLDGDQPLVHFPRDPGCEGNPHKKCGDTCDPCEGDASCSQPSGSFACSVGGKCLQVTD